MKTNRVYSAMKQTLLVATIIALALVTTGPGATQQKPQAQETVLYNFQNNGQDGYIPEAALISDKAGNLYGTTYFGGTGGCHNINIGSGCGTVFELTPHPGDAWAETVLYSFQETPDGAQPYAGLIFDKVGNLYGTTFLGGSSGYGTVFELSPQLGGAWVETVIHSFQTNGKDGNAPRLA